MIFEFESVLGVILRAYQYLYIKVSSISILKVYDGFVVHSEGANWWLQVESLVDLCSHHMEAAKT